MNKLLIHSNNTSLNQPDIFPPAEQYVFDLPLDTQDLDIYIHAELTTGQLRKQLSLADIVFIKVALSENYLEYIGLRLAYHIRLTRELGGKRQLPIVLIAEESFQFLGMTCPEPSILFTRGIYLANESLSSLTKAVNWFTDGTIRPLQDLDEFMRAITVHPPDNHLSHHSAANEWSILRWSGVLGITRDAGPLRELEQNIEGLLYYKHLQGKYPESQPGQVGPYTIAGKGKILYIDDEWNKGWDIVLQEFFRRYAEKAVSFTVVENQFKDKDSDAIVAECEKIVKEEDPDVVLLDLRLTDTDFGTDKAADRLTGLKVLQGIRKINPGIRVVLFTASNKVWNLIRLQKEGSNGFILKESPEQGAGMLSTARTMEEFAATLSKQLKYNFQKALFTKIWQAQSELQQKNIGGGNVLYNDFIKSLKSQAGIIESSLRLIDLDHPATLDISFLGCFNFFELIKNYYLKTRVVAPKPPGWGATLSALFTGYFKICPSPASQEITDLKSISKKRNDFIHEDKDHFTPAELSLIMNLIPTVARHIPG